MRPNKPFIDEYYLEVKQKTWEDVRSRPDDYILSVDTDEYAAYLIAKFGLPEIVLADDRGMQYEKDRKVINKEDFGRIRKIEHLFLQISLPVEPDARIPKILDLSPSTFFTTQPILEYRNGWIVTEVSANETDVVRAVRDLKDEVGRRNADIKKQNDQLRTTIQLWIAERRKLIQDEDQLLDQISKKVPVTLKKKVDPSTVIPPALDVKEKVRPIFRPTAKAPVKLELPPEKFFAILSLIDNCCHLFERTASTFGTMEEEQLRNVILSNLNSVFAGDAVGEAFSKKGKTDIYLRVDEGGIFIAECKYWNGQKTIDESVKQILDYLTWRDGYGVVVVFSKRVGFTKILDAASNRITTLPSFVRAFKKVNDTHFSALFSLPEDEHKLVELHFLLYNLCDRGTQGEFQN